MRQLAWNLHPDLGTPGSQVATVLVRIRLTPKKVHPWKWKEAYYCGTVPSLSNN